MCAFFIFDGDRITNERVYFDQLTIMRQLGVAHDPNTLAGRATTLISHPLTIGGALLQGLLDRRGRPDGSFIQAGGGDAPRRVKSASWRFHRAPRHRRSI